MERTPSSQVACPQLHGTIEPLEARIAPATFMVTNLKDSGPGSLHDAIDSANGADGADEIHFAKSVHGSISLKYDLPQITDSVTISGPGSGRLAIKGNHHQIFDISGTELDVTVSGLKLTGGDAVDGGAIHVDDALGTVEISKTVITGNRAVGASDGSASGNGGGLAVVSGVVNLAKSKISGNKAGTVTSTYDYTTYETKYQFDSNGLGGGIFVAAGAVLNVDHSSVNSNRAGEGGGVDNAGEAHFINHSKIQKNTALGLTDASESSQGGGVFNAGTLSIEFSTVAKNQAQGSKGASGDDSGTEPGAGGVAEGGGIFNADSANLSLVSSKITGNKALGGKGGTGATGYAGEDAYYTRRGGKGGEGGAGGDGGNAYGGGVRNFGVLVMSASKVSGNVALGGEGGRGGKGGTGGQGAMETPAYDDGYDGKIPAQPPGQGGAGGNGGSGGKGGVGYDGGISDSTGTAQLTISKVTPNQAKSGSKGSAGAVGNDGPKGEKYGSYYYSPY